ncbi:hypothetical protein NPA31_013990 [Aurantimonas sp. MSK8Z-1]|uniref:hypothetical protein n=1 Tax=Mangrovibrevibacter kandeliae TaxID=2968473 RepID=UPI002118DB9F|nr:hypothetical protein [Aurantimonas sp. MSK8Z-1]MCW4116072.1 hypothetical protein [Aurantimonas sp. MSK8Z-1]
MTGITKTPRSSEEHDADDLRRQTFDTFTLPGETDPPTGDRFVCPHGAHYGWVRMIVGEEIPECPVHGVTLVRA